MSISERLLNKAIPALSKLNDINIRINGQNVTMILPDQSDIDIYGVREATDTDEFETQLIIDWSEYKFELGNRLSAEEFDIIPLIATAKLCDSIPVGTIVNVTLIHPELGVEDNSFRVGRNEILATTKAYSRRLTLHPHRSDHY